MKKIGLGLIILLAVVSLVVLVGFALLMSLLIQPELGLGFGNTIAVIPVKGELTMEEPGIWERVLSTEEILEALRTAREDPLTAAIVLEINSPGGSIVAVKQIAQEIKKTDKPVIAYISEIGTSGGYYVAAASDEIMADADSITGSIGVISFFPNIEGLLEKLGAKVSVLKEGKFKAMGSWFEELKPEEKELIQEILKQAFENFKSYVIESRSEKLNTVRFQAIADGRILSGQQALEIGLIDSLGTKQDAIDRAAEIAGIEFPVIEDYSKKEISLFELLAQAGYNFGFGFKEGLTASMKSQGIQSWNLFLN